LLKQQFVRIFARLLSDFRFTKGVAK